MLHWNLLGGLFGHNRYDGEIGRMNRHPWRRCVTVVAHSFHRDPKAIFYWQQVVLRRARVGFVSTLSLGERGSSQRCTGAVFSLDLAILKWTATALWTLGHPGHHNRAEEEKTPLTTVTTGLHGCWSGSSRNWISVRGVQPHQGERPSAVPEGCS